MPRSDQERAGTSQSLERGLAILSQFSTDRRLIGVSEVANELGLTRSTAHRYIATLARLGYLHRDPASRKYILGPRVLDLGFTAINSMELRHVAAPMPEAPPVTSATLRVRFMAAKASSG